MLFLSNQNDEALCLTRNQVIFGEKSDLGLKLEIKVLLFSLSLSLSLSPLQFLGMIDSGLSALVILRDFTGMSYIHKKDQMNNEFYRNELEFDRASDFLFM